MQASIIREILKIAQRPGMMSFAGGLPAPATFPLKEFERAVKDTLRLDGTKALQYYITEGHPDLKAYLCNWLKPQGIRATADQMLLTHGSQQALDLLAKIFINPNDQILVENPTYLGALQSFNAYQTRYLTVDIDEMGMKPEEVEKKLAKNQVKFIYTVPTFQNPSGVTMSLERRLALLKIASRRGIPIVEDDPYGLLRFKGKTVPSLYALAKGKGVIYLSTFSKLLSPGIRLGYVLAQKEVLQQLILAKQGSDLQNNTFIQFVVHHYCKNGSLERHLPFIINDYKHRAGVMMDALHRYFPKEVTCYEPEGGMFVWSLLPKGLKASVVFERALKKNVAFVDGSVFFANGGGENTMRLNYTNASDASLKEGVRRLASVIESFL
jgi:2-aminoadipate transaminase